MLACFLQPARTITVDSKRYATPNHIPLLSSNNRNIMAKIPPPKSSLARNPAGSSLAPSVAKKLGPHARGKGKAPAARRAHSLKLPLVAAIITTPLPVAARTQQQRRPSGRQRRRAMQHTMRNPISAQRVYLPVPPCPPPGNYMYNGRGARNKIKCSCHLGRELFWRGGAGAYMELNDFGRASSEPPIISF